jgi:hypothetical protein
MTRQTENDDKSKSPSTVSSRWPYREQKMWKKVKPGTHPVNMVLAVEHTMAAYLAILLVLKTHIIEPGTVYFERDYRDDNSDSHACYCFAFEKGYFYLECDAACNMQLHYDFSGYAKEAEVLKLLKLLISFGLASHRPRQPDLPTFFKGVQAYQPQQFIHTL